MKGMNKWIWAGLFTVLVIAGFRFSRVYTNTPEITPPMAAPEVKKHPLPVSARELINNLNVVEKTPDLKPQIFKGYSSLQSPDPLELQLVFAPGDLTVSLKKRGGAKFDFGLKDLELFRFKDDPASVVIRLPDKTFIYLNWEPMRTLQSYPQPLDVMAGWMIKPDGKNVSKIVLIEEVHPSWPRPESLKEALPPDLPF